MANNTIASIAATLISVFSIRANDCSLANSTLSYSYASSSESMPSHSVRRIGRMSRPQKVLRLTYEAATRLMHSVHVSLST